MEKDKRCKQKGRRERQYGFGGLMECKERMMWYDKVTTPCYVVDEGLLENNLKILRGVMDRTGARILLAQKAFSMYRVYPLIGEYLCGATASGLYEARLGAEEMKRPLAERGRALENHIFSPAYRDKDFPEILEYCDHIVFNSWKQIEKYEGCARAAGKSIGLRINPECSTQEGHAIYDPCAPGSRLGVTRGRLDLDLEEWGRRNGKAKGTSKLDGLHFHTLCEQNADALERTLYAVEEHFGDLLYDMKWINFGGGHHITRAGYDISLLEQCIHRMQAKYGLTVYLEPGEAVALNAGFLVTTVLEVQKSAETVLKYSGESETDGAAADLCADAAAGNIAILDTSAACHMPDVLEMPYRPPLRESGKPEEKPYTYRLGGPTCLAGDIIGDYSFDAPLKEGDRLVFEDMAIYSMVKNNTFNGMPLPDIILRKKDGTLETVKQFGYEEFRGRL